MVSRGRRSFNRSQREDDNKEDEEEIIDLRNHITAGEAARIQEAQNLAQEALRLAAEAREALKRLKEYRARFTLSYREGNMIGVDDTSTLREGDDSCRSF
jgi:hypothetical protein